jgi:hypothetical protein
VFADINRKEWLRLLAGGPTIYGLHASVARIDPGLSIHCDGLRAPVHAEFVDVCGGPGQSRRLASPLVHPALWAGYASGSAGSPLLTGEHFLTSTPAAGSRVLVYGGSPTGAWCVETAQNAGCQTTWVAQGDLRDAFLATRRNDDLAQPPVTRSMRGGRWVVDSAVAPANPMTSFWNGHEVRSVRPGSRGAVDVDLAEVATGLVRTVAFDRVVTAIGQLKQLHEAGSWASILDPVLPPDIHGRGHVRRDGENRALWLETDDGRLRVLGASALSHPELEAEWRDPNSSSHHYFSSLPDQLRVGVGIGLGSMSVAAANGYFASRPNENYNLASIREMRRIAGSTIYAEMAGEWLETRSRRIHPWTKAELDHMAKLGADRF